MKDRRFHYVDAARGIAVLLVIYGHTFRESMRAAYAWCDFSYALVYRFHVSLLFLLSGFGYALTLEKNKTLTEWRYFGKKAKALLLPWFSYSVLIYVIFVAAQLFAPCRALLENTAYQKIPPAKYLAAMLKNENPYSFHLWYLQTLFLFTAVTFLKDKFLSEKYARRAAILLILHCRHFIRCFAGIGYGFSRDFSRNISFSCSGHCLYGKRWKRRLEFWQQWERAVSQRWCWKFAFCR